MANDDDNVIFEMQVERRILEEVLNNNKNIQDTYKLEAIIKKQQEKIEQLNKDNAKLLETNKFLTEEKNLNKTNNLNDLQTNKLIEELDSLKKILAKTQSEKEELDFAKLKLEQTCQQLNKKLRLQELGLNNNNLEHVESKLLKLKLQTIENEKKYLLADFEKERKIMERQNKPRIAKLEENIKLLRKWVDKERKERFPKESDEVKELKAKIATLEQDKADLIEGFELERKVFRKILKSNNCTDIYMF